MLGQRGRGILVLDAEEVTNLKPHNPCPRNGVKARAFRGHPYLRHPGRFAGTSGESRRRLVFAIQQD